MVLAAGLGTRLRPLTDLLPKPIVPVGDGTALGEVLARLKAAGSTRIVVNVHHGAARVRAAVERDHPRVTISEERDLLGTAGGLAHAAPALGDGSVLVWNADCLADVDVGRLVGEHGAGGAEATLLVQRRPPGKGSVGLDERGRVVRLRSERLADETSGGEFLGVHVIGSSLRALLPPVGCVVGDVYIPAMMRGAGLRAVLYAGPFVDIGTPRSYLEANLAWLERHAPGGHWVGAGADVSPTVSIERAIVGAGASVRGHGSLERCVVWPGATATAPLKEAIVAGDLVVRIA
jgi:mannose-1-phosphate guanylyltransferase